MDIAAHLRQQLGDRLKEHEVLRPYSAFKIGGVADFFYEARTVQELVEAVTAACAISLPYLVIGGGSQVVISDYGFPGLVIRNLSSTISFITPQSQVIVDSGVIVPRLVMEGASRDLGGIEFLATLPATVGGAIYSNHGSFGYTISTYIRSVTVLHPPHKIATYKKEWLVSRYSSTCLKQMKTHPCPPVVLTAKLQLQHYKKEEIVRKISYFKKLAPVAERITISQPAFLNPSGQPSKLGDDSEAIRRSASGVIRRLKNIPNRVGSVSLYPFDPVRFMHKGNGKAHDIRHFTALIKQRAAETEGVLLEDALEYVGKWE